MARGGTKASGERSSKDAARGGDEILAFEDDPGAPGAEATPVPRPAPKLDASPLPVAIVGRGRPPSPKRYEPGTGGFRHWVAAEALRRCADFWGSLLPGGVSWFPTNGKQLRVALDQGQDLNAFYDRRGLQFFHDTVAGVTVFSGESPDVICHEMGHAVFDALSPATWDAASIEVAAFHESFGDMSAILCALQLKSVRDDVLVATGGRLQRSSRISRVAEQLGWAIRQVAPGAADPDCLRNAANSFFYREPATLPPSAPASELSSAPHSFSRVFTAAFLRALAGVFNAQPSREEPALLRASHDLAQLLVEATSRSPIVPSYYSQVAGHMLLAEEATFGGRYRDALKSAFVRHGILSLESAAAAPREAPAKGIAAAVTDKRSTELPRLAITGARYGLPGDLLVHVAAEPKRLSLASAAPDLGSAEAASHERAA